MVSADWLPFCELILSRKDSLQCHLTALEGLYVQEQHHKAWLRV